MKSPRFSSRSSKLRSRPALAAALPARERPLYLDASQPLEARVEDLLGRMTIEEKIALLHGDSKFTTAAIPRLGIPRRWMSDGPHGVREDIGPDTWDPAGRTDDFATCMPAAIALAAAWNPDTARAYGQVVGEEALKRGKHIMLGPGVNLMRSPLCGRNFEYFGEDPFLASRLVVGYINGVQSCSVASCVKHFAANNQETERGSINVEMDERTLREIYLPAFQAAVQEAGVLAVMGAYNRFRGQYCCHNDYLLNQVLKGEWGFIGLVVTDWGGAHDTREAALNGLDLEMGSAGSYQDFFLANPYLAGLKKGGYPLAVLDDKARRNLRQIIATKMLDGRPEGSINTPAHQNTARRVAEEAVVLLKNEGGALPLDASKIKTLAVIGENATRLQACGGDSSRIKAFYEISPLQGILNRVGNHVNVTFSAGYSTSGDAEVSPDANLAANAVAAAKAADVVIYIGGLNHDRGGDTEGSDRTTLALPAGQAGLIRKIVRANPRTVVVLVGGSPMEMDPWLAGVPAVLLSWYSGMEGGNAIARILFGDVNPSGKLPCTFPKKLEDSPAHALRAYPGSGGVVKYEEGLLVGYRWYDARKIEPLFSFGHGLSYTTFQYSGLKTSASKLARNGSITVSVGVRNTGRRAGDEVVQLYVRHLQSAVKRPVKELKGFHRVSLKPGERKTVKIPLPAESLAYWNEDRHAFTVENGRINLMVGGSSADIQLRKTIEVE